MHRHRDIEIQKQAVGDKEEQSTKQFIEHVSIRIINEPFEGEKKG